MRTIRSYLHAFFAFAVLIGPTGISVRAGQTAVSDSQFNWQEPAYSPCGQECLYAKGNEAISLEALYIIRKLGLLQTALNEERHEEVAKNLPGFCTRIESDGEEGANQCFKRYRDIQILTLMKVRAALAINTGSRYMLNSQAAAVFSRGQNGDPPGGLKAPLPYVPLMKDLEKRYANNPDLHSFIGLNYQKWASELQAKPSDDEFVVFERVPKDENDPTAGYWDVAKRNPDGTLKKDLKARDAAIEFWKRSQERAGNVLEDYADTPFSPSEFRGRRNLKDNVPVLSIKAFDEARGQMVDSANQFEPKPRRVPARNVAAPTNKGPESGADSSLKDQARAMADFQKRLARGQGVVGEVTLGRPPAKRIDPQTVDATKEVKLRPPRPGDDPNGLYIFYGDEALTQDIKALQDAADRP